MQNIKKRLFVQQLNTKIDKNKKASKCPKSLVLIHYSKTGKPLKAYIFEPISMIQGKSKLKNSPQKKNVNICHIFLKKILI